MGRTYSLRPSGDDLETMLAVPMTTPPGKGTVRIALDIAAGSAELAAPVRILRRRFGIQRLTMKKGTLALYSAPGVEEEYRAIRAALAIESADRLWQPPFIQPCAGRIGTSFGLHRIINRKDKYRHRGVDLSAPRGTPVAASNAGIVTLAREDFALHGRTVIIDHGQGLSSLSIHLDSIAVVEGQNVQKGEMIGAVGDSGAATGPHVHWAFYIHGICVDPFAVIKFPWPAPSP
jgi:murein DD-endopeptidase MepM/ murein hydrolase activator NlpD